MDRVRAASLGERITQEETIIGAIFNQPGASFMGTRNIHLDNVSYSICTKYSYGSFEPTEHEANCRIREPRAFDPGNVEE